MSMWEPFTERARRSIVLAQEEAQRLGHNYIGTEHILLGLIDEGESLSAKVLETLGVNLAKVRQEVEAIVEYFRDEERRTALQEFVSEIENLFEIISPDAFLRPYLNDYDAIMRISAIVREAFYPGLDVDRSFLRKTARSIL